MYLKFKGSLGGWGSDLIWCKHKCYDCWLWPCFDNSFQAYIVYKHWPDTAE